MVIVPLVKYRSLYLNPYFAVGVVLVLLGAGNWVVGVVQVTQYRALVEAGSKTGPEGGYRDAREVVPRDNRRTLGRIHEEQERYNAARVKLDFFHVVRRGGLLLFMVGVGLASVALARTVRRNASAGADRPAAR